LRVWPLFRRAATCFNEEVQVEKKLTQISLFVSLLLLFSLNGESFANAVFKLTASQNTLGVSDTAVIGLWANIEEQSSGLNGINVWQLDMRVDVDDVISVTDVQVLQPAPLDPMLPEYGSINSTFDGNVLGIGGGVMSAPQDSSVGVGGFTLLANITVQAIGVGQTTYSLNGDTAGFYVWLRDYFAMGDPQSDYNASYASPYKAVFEPTPDNAHVFTVVPEPGTFILLGCMALAASSRRKTASRK